MNQPLNWQPCSPPQPTVLIGDYCRLEPMGLQHADELYDASVAPGCEDRFRYLTIEPQSREEFSKWLDLFSKSSDPLYFAVIDLKTKRCEGRQSLMRIDTNNGVIEIGNILWGPAISRSRVATEAFFLTAQHVFETLGFRRFEWKCDALNMPSRAAALRFGFRFEGIFRQHMVVKGYNRDTAWFSMLDSEWDELRKMFTDWFAPENFDSQGKQRSRLQDFRIQ
ncbi:MAG: GNAT family N-acetyltransferase [Pirellula sp.]|nr:GNAT family N-acetyltransferase [Pirellula sp.]